MNNNICLCGAQASYPHKEDCPYPYYGNDPDKIKQWEKDQYALHIKWPGYYGDYNYE